MDSAGLVTAVLKKRSDISAEMVRSESLSVEKIR